MICYRCGHPLGSGQFCLHCGADVRLYRKIVRLSLRYYNSGLEKARVRDLTGAAEDLSFALQIDKKNTLARNLLGLVLYEMGETVRALCEWIVSTHYQPENNPASGYVKYLQDNRLEMDTASQGIRKFNFALDYARKGSEDLAILQLEWVASHHPRMIKAHSLLALLYYSEGKYSKAERELRTVLKADTGNTFCLHMLREMAEDLHAPQIGRKKSLRESAAAAVEEADRKTEKVRTALRGRPAFWLKILLTAAVLLCAGAGILLPSLERSRSRAVSEAVARYSMELESVHRDLDTDRELRDAYGVFLEMYRLDPAKEEDLARIHALYDSLATKHFEDSLYNDLYDSWKAYLPRLDQEAASRAASPSRTPRPQIQD